MVRPDVARHRWLDALGTQRRFTSKSFALDNTWWLGYMHGDLQKSAKDTTLEHSLFAAFNTD